MVLDATQLPKVTAQAETNRPRQTPNLPATSPEIHT